MTNEADYIIVGSGAAGSVLADRLSRGGRHYVLVLEAGGPDDDEELLRPANFAAVGADPRWTRQIATEPFGGGRVEQWAEGRVAGGSTTVNGMIWNRGWAGDYEAWHADGWTWSRMLTAFRALERHDLGGSEFRGGSGAQVIGVAGRDPASDLWIETLRRQGVPVVDDLNSSGGERVAYAPLSVAGGTRMSAKRAFLDDADVRLVLNCEVRRITFDGTTATGVEAVTPDGPVRFTARREVIVCAGALETPLLLERSGIGDPRVLAAAGVPVVAENPAVGGNLRQHRGIVLFTRFGEPPSPPFGTATVAAVLRADPGGSAPDTDLLFYPFAGPNPGAALGFYPHSPTSAGSIHITGPEPGDAPRLVPNYLSTDHDRKLLVAGYARVREILAAEPFASFATVAGQVPEGDDEEALVRYSLEFGAVVNHQAGTCALGPGGAVDDRLRVRGTDRLRVAGASVMPTLPAGNTAAPSMAVGWIAGDLIRR